MENDEPMSPDEIKLREWLTANDLYPGQLEMQSMVINSFYSEFEEQVDEDNLISLEDVDLDTMEGFDYRANEKSDEEEEQEWNLKISYGLNNSEKFLAYINQEWR